VPKAEGALRLNSLASSARGGFFTMVHLGEVEGVSKV
jgi:hypothetical protein